MAPEPELAVGDRVAVVQLQQYSGMLPFSKMPEHKRTGTIVATRQEAMGPLCYVQLDNFAELANHPALAEALRLDVLRHNPDFSGDPTRVSTFPANFLRLA